MKTRVLDLFTPLLSSRPQMLGKLPSDCIKVTGAAIQEVNGFYQPLNKLHMGHRRWKNSANEEIILRRGDEGFEWQWVFAKTKYDFDLKKEVSTILYKLEASNRIERMPQLTGWTANARLPPSSRRPLHALSALRLCSIKQRALLYCIALY